VKKGDAFCDFLVTSPSTHNLSQHYFATFFTRNFLLIALGGNGYAFSSLSSPQSGVKWMIGAAQLGFRGSAWAVVMAGLMNIVVSNACRSFVEHDSAGT
jgi:hypothetical protein